MSLVFTYPGRQQAVITNDRGGGAVYVRMVERDLRRMTANRPGQWPGTGLPLPLLVRDLHSLSLCPGERTSRAADRPSVGYSSAATPPLQLTPEADVGRPAPLLHRWDGADKEQPASDGETETFQM